LAVDARVKTTYFLPFRFGDLGRVTQLAAVVQGLHVLRVAVPLLGDEAGAARMPDFGAGFLYCFCPGPLLLGTPVFLLTWSPAACREPPFGPPAASDCRHASTSLRFAAPRAIAFAAGP
jgi:hypothetical protein